MVTALLWVMVACGGGDGGSARATPSSSEGSARAGPNGTAGDVAATASSSGKARAPECSGRPLRALLIGTSLTAGYGLEPDQAYPALLQGMADSAGYTVEIVNAGVSGETSAGALRRADWILRAPVDVVVLETGANDGLRGLDPEATRRNIRAILDQARAAHPGARLLLVQMEAPPNLGAVYTSRFHAMFPALAREGGATLVPFLLEGVAGRAELNQGDGIHPNVVGARRVAANVWPSLRAAVAALDPCQDRK